MARRIKRRFKIKDNIRNNRNYRNYRQLELKEERHILNQLERDRRKDFRKRKTPVYNTRSWHAYMKYRTIQAKNIQDRKNRNTAEHREIERINEICRKRKERRETLFAKKGSGGGFSKKRKRNITEDSKIKC